MPHVATPYIIHTVKDLDIWTIQVDNHIYQFRDFDDVLIEIGRAAITGGKHVTILDDDKKMLDVEISVQDVEAA